MVPTEREDAGTQPCAGGTPTFRPLQRTTSSSAWSAADAPASSAHDLPESSAMAALERTTSQISTRSERSRRAYAGGAGLGGKVSRRGPLVVGREGRIEEDSEAVTVDEEAAVGEKNEAVQETADRAEAMYARFSPRRKRLIVAVVAYTALLARAYDLDCCTRFGIYLQFIAAFSSSSFLPSIP